MMEQRPEPAEKEDAKNTTARFVHMRRSSVLSCSVLLETGDDLGKNQGETANNNHSCLQGRENIYCKSVLVLGREPNRAEAKAISNASCQQVNVCQKF